MHGIAAVAVKGTAVASGLSTTWLPRLSPGALDGFAAGTLLTGLCFLLVMAPRTRRRGKPSARNGAWLSAPHNPMTPDLSDHAVAKVLARQPHATPAYAQAYARTPYLAATYPAAVYATSAYFAKSKIANPLADESSEVMVTRAQLDASAQLADLVNGRSPRQYQADAPRRGAEARRSSGRHAAPPIGVASRMASWR